MNVNCYIPPVTPIPSPVTAAALLEAKKTAVAPISEGSSRRFIHWLPKIWGLSASSTVVPSCSASFGNPFRLILCVLVQE